MISLVFELLIDEVFDGNGESFVIIFSIAVDDDVFGLEGGFVAVERDLFDWFVDVWEMEVAVNIKELE